MTTQIFSETIWVDDEHLQIVTCGNVVTGMYTYPDRRKIPYSKYGFICSHYNIYQGISFKMTYGRRFGEQRHDNRRFVEQQFSKWCHTSP